MAIYVSADRLRLAVDRLRQCRASGGMINFLILKRALALKPPDGFVRFSTKDEFLQKAIDELMWWPEDADDPAARPFVNVFGIPKKNFGMMLQKYRSNGPGDTLRNRAWETVVQTKQTEDALAAKLTPNYLNGIGKLAVVRDTRRPMPRVDDAAVWYFRRRDIQPFIGGTREQPQVERKLIDKFTSDMDLSREDLSILFDPETIPDAK